MQWTFGNGAESALRAVEECNSTALTEDEKRHPRTYEFRSGDFFLEPSQNKGVLNMENNRVLIVSDSPDRRYFLEYYTRRHHLAPVRYLNIISARKAVRLDPFCMVVVDLSMPLEPKLALVKEACRFQQNAQVVTIEKSEYLEETGALASLSSLVKLDSLDSFSDELRAYASSIQVKKAEENGVDAK